MKVLLVFAVCMLCVYGKVTPDYFPQCKRSDPQIEKCVLEAVETLRPRLKTGIPEIHIPQLEPFSLPTLKLDRNIPNLRLKAVIKNVKAIGGSNFKIEKLRIHLNNKYAAEVKLHLPRLSVSGEYDARGSRLLALDINGKGRLLANFTGITVVAKGSAKSVERDGVQYLTADKIVTKVRINHGQIAIEDTERPLAAASAVSFFNASPGVVLDILNPLIEESAAAILKTYANKILATVPLAEVLADRK